MCVAKTPAIAIARVRRTIFFPETRQDKQSQAGSFESFTFVQARLSVALLPRHHLSQRFTHPSIYYCTFVQTRNYISKELGRNVSGGKKRVK